MRPDSYKVAKLRSVPVPAVRYIVAVDGRPQRRESYTSQAAAHKAASLLARYSVGCRVTIYRCEPVAAMVDPV